MLDSQKLSFENFLMGLKHGVYIFTKDGCQACEDYKREIAWENSCFLYIVETTTEEERNILAKLVGRNGFPVTVGYWENEIKFVDTGIKYEKDWVQIHKFLERFPTKPLTIQETQTIIEKQKNRCLLTYYAIPEKITGSDRQAIIDRGYTYNEFPIDIDSVCPSVPNNERERMLEGCYHFAKLVLWKGGPYSNFTNDIILDYTIHNQEITFIERDLDDSDNSN